MRNSGGASPASVVQSSPHHDQAPSRMRPGAHRPFGFARPATCAGRRRRGGFILKRVPRHCTRPVEHDARRCGERYCLESLQAGKRCRCAVSAQGADARRLMVCRIQQPRPRSSLGRSRGPALSVRCARHGVGDEGVGGAARRRRASRQGGRAAVSGSASGCSPHSLAAGGKRSGAGCEPLRLLLQLNL